MDHGTNLLSYYDAYANGFQKHYRRVMQLYRIRIELSNYNIIIITTYII